jgi:hypothetical protein
MQNPTHSLSSFPDEPPRRRQREKQASTGEALTESQDLSETLAALIDAPWPVSEIVSIRHRLQAVIEDLARIEQRLREQGR